MLIGRVQPCIYIYRDRHHSPFIYHGPLCLVSYDLHGDRPSRFVFQVLARVKTIAGKPHIGLTH